MKILLLFLLIFPFRIIAAGTHLPGVPFYKPALITAHPFSESLFDQDSVITVMLSGNVRELFDDRSDTPNFYPFSLNYKGSNGADVTLPVDMKTRGHFRKQRGNCQMPPLLISFSKKEQTANTLFNDQTQLKLVVPCRGDEYVVREWLVYKIYNLVTPKSFRGRLVKVELNDIQKKKKYTPFYGLLLEDESSVAKRNNNVLVKQKLQRPEAMDRQAFLNMAVFEYLIGNTDWSVQYLQNIKLLAVDTLATPTTVPYDFDLAGIVSSPYALPAEELLLSSVRERRYRGFCITDMSQFDSTIALFNRLKKDIYEVYQNCTLTDDKYKKDTFKYLDAFYQTINDPKSLQHDFGYPCDPNGTGNVVIKGLAKD